MPSAPATGAYAWVRVGDPPFFNLLESFFFSVEQVTNGVPLDVLNGLAAWCLGHSLCCYAFAEDEIFRRIKMVIVMVCREIHIHAMWDTRTCRAYRYVCQPP